MNSRILLEWIQPPRPARSRVWIALTLIAAMGLGPAVGQTPPISPGPLPPPGAAGTAPPGVQPMPDAASSGGTNALGEIQLSFQGANIEMVVQWLAKTTGKSVAKHPRVQCQLTIVSSRTLPVRDAVNLVYRALALEGFTTIESSRSILIVPEGQEPKLSPELVDGSEDMIPEGRQRLIKIFPLEHARASELRERVKILLSEKGTIEVDDRSNRLIATDLTENIQLLSEFIKELDVASATDATIELYPLKYADADDLANLLSLVLNAQSGGGGGASPASPSAASVRPMPSGRPMMMPEMPTPSGPSPGPGPSPSPSPSSPTQAGGSGIRIWSDRTANRLVVSAPKSKHAEIRELIGLLDSEKPEDVAVRVIPLRHVNAQDLVREIGTLYQRMSGRALKDIIEVTANERSNSLIVLSSETNYRGIMKLVASLDTADAQEKVLRAFPLKNADAEDVAKQLQDLGQDRPTASRYVYYFSAPEQSSGRMNVVADRRRNTVIVQAPPGAMKGIAEMIEELDEPVTDSGLAPRIFQLKYVSAVDIEDVLNELFLRKTEQRSYWDYYYDEAQSSTDRDVGRLYGKVRITSEPYSNSIIVTSNSPENLEAVEEVLRQLDVPSQAGDTTLRLSLKFADAVDLASSLNILFARGGSPPLRPVQPAGTPGDPRTQQAQAGTSPGSFELEREAKQDAYFPWLGGQQEDLRGADGRSTIRPVSELIGRVRVVPDRRSNSLLITSNVHFFPQVLKLINELDAPTAQVLIEARIIEVASDFRQKLGIRWSPDGSQVFDAEDMDNSMLVETTTAYQRAFGAGSGLLDSTISLDFLIQFLRKNTDAVVLAEPQLNVSDNEIGKLFVGAQVPFITGSLNTPEGGRNDSFQYKDVGVILEVTPHIKNENEVDLKIRAESSNLRSGQTLFGGAILDTRNFRTDVLVKNGQTLVLGGIILKERGETIRKVPILGDIPLMGYLFKKRDLVSRDVELLVFLRPRITRTPREAQQLLEEIERRTPRIQQWERDNPPAEDPAATGRNDGDVPRPRG